MVRDFALPLCSVQCIDHDIYQTLDCMFVFDAGFLQLLGQLTLVGDVGFEEFKGRLSCQCR